jgi:hypothetical protein
MAIQLVFSTFYHTSVRYPIVSKPDLTSRDMKGFIVQHHSPGFMITLLRKFENPQKFENFEF